MRARLAAMVTLCAMLVAATPAPGQGTTANGAFFDLFLKGCLPAALTETSIKPYAQAAKLSPAPPLMVARFGAMMKDPIGFMTAGAVPVFILQGPATWCMVNSLRPADPDAVFGRIEAGLNSDGKSFRRAPGPEEHKSQGNASLSRSYFGHVAGKAYVVTVMIVEDARRQPQAVASIRGPPR
ncbi:hypothetical protein ACI7BZ_03530 [Xanthobacter sp. AM11]|uniref:hypothetical protein n=1 Tax=Xanthobacter sp. AM11 TaxID=3380643 RepID=UPI0039BF314A